MRHWIREGRLRAETAHGQHMVDAGVLNEVRDELHSMLPLPPEWQVLG